jgi:hypothetical protein
MLFKMLFKQPYFNALHPSDTLPYLEHDNRLNRLKIQLGVGGGAYRH